MLSYIGAVKNNVTLAIRSQGGDELDSLLVPFLHGAEQFDRVTVDVRDVNQPVMGIAEQHKIGDMGFQLFR